MSLSAAHRLVKGGSGFLAINKLEGQSTAWQATLTQLEKELVADAHP